MFTVPGPLQPRWAGVLLLRSNFRPDRVVSARRVCLTRGRAPLADAPACVTPGHARPPVIPAHHAPSRPAPPRAETGVTRRSSQSRAGWWVTAGFSVHDLSIYPFRGHLRSNLLHWNTKCPQEGVIRTAFTGSRCHGPRSGHTGNWPVLDTRGSSSVNGSFRGIYCRCSVIAAICSGQTVIVVACTTHDLS